MSARGRAIVEFDSSQRIQSRLIAVGSSAANLESNIVKIGGLDSTGSSAVSFDAESRANATLSIVAMPSVDLRGQTRSQANLSIQGRANVSLETLRKSIGNTGFSLAGEAQVNLVGARIFYQRVDLFSSGSSSTDLVAFPAANATLSVSGVATVRFRQGSAVVRFMPIAADVTIRPEENRTATWQ